MGNRSYTSVVSLRVENKEQIKRIFDGLTPENQKPIYKKALQAGAKVLKDEIKIKFKTTNKGFSKSGYSNITKTLKSSAMYRKAGIKVGYQGEDAYKTHWINWGAGRTSGNEGEGRYTKKMKRYKVPHYSGIIKRTNFFYDAVLSKEQEANDTLSEVIIKETEKFINSNS